MKKHFKRTAITTALILAINCFTAVTLAQETEYGFKSNENETQYSSDNAVLHEKQYSDYDLAVSNLLRMGWTMDEINDLPEEEILKYSNVISFETSENYLCTYIDEDGCEQTVAVSKDMYEYTRAKTANKESITDNKLSKMSSNGKLSITPIWSSENYSSYAFSNKMSQKANLTWKGNNTYFANYRCEWETEPNVQWRDAVYICNNSGLDPSFSTSYFVYKYDRYRNLMNEEVWREWKDNYVIGDGYLVQETSKNGVGYVFDFSEDIIGNDDYISETSNHRIYMSNSYAVNSGYNSVVTSAGYYHATSKLANTKIDDITSTGVTLNSNLFIELCDPTLYLNATNY